MILRLSASIMLLTVLPGRAQPAASSNRSAAISQARMRSLLESMDVDFTESSSADSTVFTFQLNGHPVTLLNQVTSMQLSACLEDDFDPLKANQWNQVHYSTGVQLDEHGCAALRANVNFAGGVTNKMIEAFVRGFCTDVTIYTKFLTGPPSGPGTTPAPPDAGVQPENRSARPIGAMAWSQLGQPMKPTEPAPDAAGSDAGLLQIHPNISLKYDPGRWKQTGSSGEEEFALSHSSGEGHALVIRERTAVPLDAIVDIALANAQSADPAARVVFRNKRRVNGTVLYFLKIEANVDTVPMVYCGYFYAGDYGTVQVVTYTAKTLLSEHEHDFMEFLNGLVISRSSARDDQR